MKGASAGIEFVGKVLITAFIVVVIVILMAQFLPGVFSGGACVGKQVENVNALMNEAVGTRSTEIKSFTVESCVEFVDFSELRCSDANGGSPDQRCYEVLGVGEPDSRFASIPGDYNVFEISSQTGGLRYVPGKYLVEIGPYSIKFLETVSSSE